MWRAGRAGASLRPAHRSLPTVQAGRSRAGVSAAGPVGGALDHARRRALVSLPGSRGGRRPRLRRGRLHRGLGRDDGPVRAPHGRRLRAVVERSARCTTAELGRAARTLCRVLAGAGPRGDDRSRNAGPGGRMERAADGARADQRVVVPGDLLVDRAAFPSTAHVAPPRLDPDHDSAGHLRRNLDRRSQPGAHQHRRRGHDQRDAAPDGVDPRRVLPALSRGRRPRSTDHPWPGEGPASTASAWALAILWTADEREPPGSRPRSDVP